jgi:hypothetical protein
LDCHLTVVAAEPEEPVRFDPAPFSLKAQPQRPGELAELVDIDMPPTVATRVRATAADSGLPAELWLYIAVEAERAVDEATSVFGIERDELVVFIEAAARIVPPRAPRHVLVRRLEEYGAALIGAGSAPPANGSGLTIRVPHRVSARWAHAAAEAGKPFDRWLEDMVVAARAGRERWEASAACDARTLAEWVLLQAARWARSRSTSPQATASG